jgi:hypothetical protein
MGCCKSVSGSRFCFNHFYFGVPSFPVFIIARGVLRIIRLLLLTIIPSFAIIFCIYLGFAYFYLVLPCETLAFFIPGAMGINGVNASFHINIYMIS